MNMMKVVAVPMHPEGRKFVAVFAAVTAALWLVWEPLFWLGLGLTTWCYYFFRDPVRSVAQRPGLILSPADGVVSLITKTVPPADMQLGDKPIDSRVCVHECLQLSCEPRTHGRLCGGDLLSPWQVSQRIFGQGERAQ